MRFHNPACPPEEDKFCGPLTWLAEKIRNFFDIIRNMARGLTG